MHSGPASIAQKRKGVFVCRPSNNNWACPLSKRKHGCSILHASLPRCTARHVIYIPMRANTHTHAWRSGKKNLRWQCFHGFYLAQCRRMFHLSEKHEQDDFNVLVPFSFIFRPTEQSPTWLLCCCIPFLRSKNRQARSFLFCCDCLSGEGYGLEGFDRSKCARNRSKAHAAMSCAHNSILFKFIHGDRD
jgi:hypothetical protein